MHVIPHGWAGDACFCAECSADPGRTSRTSHRLASSGPSPHTFHKVLIILKYSTAVAAQADHGYTIPLVAT
jgi:hypothetical protein